ncbi:GNAT family N-acetyltransferase [Crenobacter sp. SG2305]|uniref:GNAT family N-acetyltransferase n=1 Tax=Crenobacter oryzisoli TaxID=3056844 RepID=UPI0025AA41BA|nr:GNAT family N-acetyltransferase [Crenobacter sp. SG2305]MDN0082429.1 GNAT family N-acetyltransferase [Crenobacter sp. SG2305]
MTIPHPIHSTAMRSYHALGPLARRGYSALVYLCALLRTLFDPHGAAERLRAFLADPVTADADQPAGDAPLAIQLGEPLWLGGDQHRFVIKAYHQGGEVGRVVAERCAATRSCYVIDVIVHNEKLRRRGIGGQLLRAALAQAEAEVLVPVTITAEALPKWCHMALSGRWPVRLGLSHLEQEVVRHKLQPSAWMRE